MKPEEEARTHIDDKLQKANWILQDRLNINLGAGPGIAIQEFSTNAGPVDYALFAERKAISVIEAKPTGSTNYFIEIPTSAQNMGGEDIHSLRKFPSYLLSATYFQT
jgi:type I site-specific restriction endonuclease